MTNKEILTDGKIVIESENEGVFKQYISRGVP